MEQDYTLPANANRSSRHNAYGNHGGHGIHGRPAQLEHLPSGPTGLSHSSSNKAKKRVLTSACLPCRKRKSRCDSVRPLCSACKSVYHTPCSYDAESEPSKKAPAPRSLSLETSPTSPFDKLDQIVQSLRDHRSGNEVLIEQLEDVRLQLQRFDFRSQIGSATSLSQAADQSELEDLSSPLSIPVNELSFAASTLGPSLPKQVTGIEQPGPGASWFTHPPYEPLVNELFELYFAVDNAFYNIISPAQFLADYRSGGTHYCSAILVHAIMAAALNYHHGKLVATAPEDARKARAYGEAFHREAMRLMFRAVDSSLTTVQALAIIALREASSGREEHGYRWHGLALRMALEMNMHVMPARIHQDIGRVELEVRRNTFWAVYNLEVKFAVLTGKVSQFANNVHGLQKPSYEQVKRDSIADPLSRKQLGALEAELNARRPDLSLIQHYCELSEIANDANVMLYTPGHRIDLASLKQALARFTAWEHALAPHCQLTASEVPSPVLLLHMYYRQLLIGLFRPFQPYDLSAEGVDARIPCLANAKMVISLWRTIRKKGLGHISIATISALREAACAFMLNYEQPDALDLFDEALSGLLWLSTCHMAARRSIQLLRDLATRWNIKAPDLVFKKYLPGEKAVESMKVPSLAPFAVQAHIDEATIPQKAFVFDPASRTYHVFQPHLQSHQNQQQQEHQHHNMVPPLQQHELGTQQPQQLQHQPSSPLLQEQAQFQAWAMMAPEHDPYFHAQHMGHAPNAFVPSSRHVDAGATRAHLGQHMMQDRDGNVHMQQHAHLSRPHHHHHHQ